MRTVEELQKQKKMLEGFTGNQWRNYILTEERIEKEKENNPWDLVELSKQPILLENLAIKLESALLRDELIQNTTRYEDHEYTRYIEDNAEPINDELTYEDRFYLLKYLYIRAKDCTEIGYLLKEEFNEWGYSPDDELENIKKIFNGKEKITVYRGVNNYNLKDGCSYTLDREKAEWFANRYKSDGYVIEKEITVDDVIFYSNERKEQEVFLNI